MVRHRDSQALFASADYDITPSLDLSAGVRWTRDAESIDLQLLNYWLDHFGTLDLGVPGTAISPPLGLLGTRDRTHWNEPSGDVTLKWKFGVRSNVYFRYARGYRAGQYNITNAIGPVTSFQTRRG